MQYPLKVNLNLILCLDNEAPDITCPADQITITDYGQPTGLVGWEEPTASDNSGYEPDVFCTPPPGTNFHIGLTIVKCEAFDEMGNINSCEFSIEVEEGKMFSFFFLSEATMFIVVFLGTYS